MFEKLDALKNQYDELTARMEMPETYSDPALYAKCEREARELAPLVGAYAAYKKAQADMESARQLMDEPELRELAQEEYLSAKAEHERLEREIKLLLLPKDPNDGKNVIMEIRGGVGGEEGMLLLPTSSACTRCMPSGAAGSSTWRTSTRRSLAV